MFCHCGDNEEDNISLLTVKSRWIQVNRQDKRLLVEKFTLKQPENVNQIYISNYWQCFNIDSNK